MTEINVGLNRVITAKGARKRRIAHLNVKMSIPCGFDDPGFLDSVLAEIAKVYPEWSLTGYVLQEKG